MRRDPREYLSPHAANCLLNQGFDVYACVFKWTEFVNPGTYKLNDIPWVYRMYIVNYMSSDERSLYIEGIHNK